MENASKALIIAGAILLSILIISLGIMVYNNAKNTVGNNNLSKQEIESFNSQWDSYVGKNKTASEIKTLCSAAIANNASEKTQGSGRYIKITGKGIDISETGSATKTTVPILSNTTTYTVEITTYSNGLITVIKVS